MTQQERVKRLNALGYFLRRNYYCPIRRKVMPWATVPSWTGTTCVHEDLKSVDARIENAEKIRSWQDLSTFVSSGT